MRIIAGSARGRTLTAPKGQATRPTQDYIRESLFNILQRDVPDANVLDLFAGSGALALEALSRGAAYAALVDHSAAAVACIRQNIAVLRMEEQTAVYAREWEAALRPLREAGQRFSLVFLDPPYRMDDTAAICLRLAQEQLLEAGALIVVEHRKEADPGLTEPFKLQDQRSYGQTGIHFYRYGGETR